MSSRSSVKQERVTGMKQISGKKGKGSIKMLKKWNIQTQRHPNGQRTHSCAKFLTPKSTNSEHIEIHQVLINRSIEKVGEKGLKNIPELYATEDKESKDVKVQLVFWCPLTKATWWVTERDKEDPELLFGFCSVVTGGGELGYFRVTDIAAYCSAAGAPAILEDFTGATGHTLSEVRSAYLDGRLLY